MTWCRIITFIFLSCLGGLVSPGWAQKAIVETRAIDSLKHVIFANKRLKVSNNLLLKNTCDLAGYYRLINPDSAIHYYEVAQTLAKTANVDSLDAFLNEQLGNLYLAKGMTFTALEYFFTNYKLHQKSGDLGSIAFTLCDIGNTYFASLMYDEALVYYRKSIKIFESINHNYGKSVIYNNLGMVYTVKNNYDSALYYYEKSLQLRKQMNDHFLVIHTRSYIARLYLNMNKPEEALRVLDEALYLLNNINLPYNEEVEYRVEMLVMKSKAWSGLKNFYAARENLNAAFKIAEEVNSNYLKSEIYFNLAMLENEMGRSKEALRNVQAALELSSKGENFTVYRSALFWLASLNEKLGRTKIPRSIIKKLFTTVIHY
ncbi:MAG: tetratricopeptide repeat protein [Bacteroidales bacterium]